jgi:trans-2,3-dihydro-3-hydroxyanthranilate isomerase
MGIRRYRYRHLDVFTDRRFGGNQLAVFPDANGLSTDTMQLMAREMNFAESTFVLPAETEGTDVRMRIFTPATEMPMAGHPVIGSTFALAREGRIPKDRPEWIYELNVGPLPVQLEWQDEELAFAWMTQRSPQFGEPEDPAAVAAAIGLSEQEIRSTGLPVQCVSCGVPFVMVPLSSRAAVDAAAPDARILNDLAKRSGRDHFSLYLFTTDRNGSDDGAHVYTRMFGPGLGIYEDPATGSASGALGAYLVRHQVLSREAARTILNLQGRKLGRPSWIHISIDSNNGTFTRVRVGGAAVFVAEGTFDV